ncbi:Innexin [Aphelenchoides fujianensis]|nr:Innexin [Aphelenchoides fujianensis]
MIGAIAPYLSRIKRSYQSNDIIDRLNYQYTAVIIALACFTLTATQYVGKPIHILGLQAFMFYLPALVWKSLNFNTGINVKSVLNSAALVKKKFDKGTRSSQVQKAASHLIEALEMQRELKTSKFFLSKFGKRNGIYLSALYLFTKFLYILNVLVQFVLMNAFLAPKYQMWGYVGTDGSGTSRRTSRASPSCDFNVRVLGNIHRWTVQCVIMINMFNEKIFVFLWFCFAYWFFAIILKGSRRSYVQKYLRCTSAIREYPTAREHDIIDSFVRRFLRSDGVFLLRLIQTNGGDLLTGEILNAMFTRYRTKLEEQSRSQALTESPNSGVNL